MYCEQCGTQIPDGGGFCPQCGKATSYAVPASSMVDSSDGKKQTSDDGGSMRGKKGNRLPRGKMKAILIVSAIVVLALVSLGAFVLFGQSSEPRGIRIPTLEEIEKKANSIDGGTVRLEESGFEDAFFIYMDDNLVGWINLKEYQPQCIGLHIDKGRADDGQLAFAQTCVGVIEACDPSLGLDGAKEIASEIASGSITGSAVECNGVTYAPDFSEDKYGMLITVPDECVNQDRSEIRE